MLIKAISYCNPFSEKYREVAKNYPKLCLSKKIGIAVATIFATLITLPIFGIGGTAAFRYLTSRCLPNKANPQRPNDADSSNNTNSEDFPGLYLKSECMCSSTVKKVGTKGSFNIILLIDRTAINCLKCTKENQSSNHSILVQGLNHEVSYKEMSMNNRKESMKKDQVIIKENQSQYPSIFVQSLDYETLCQEMNMNEVNRKVSMKKDQTVVYPLNACYAYFEIKI